MFSSGREGEPASQPFLVSGSSAVVPGEQRLTGLGSLVFKGELLTWDSMLPLVGSLFKPQVAILFP